MVESAIRQRRANRQVQDILGLDSSQTTDKQQFAEKFPHPGHLKVERYRDQEPEAHPPVAELKGIELQGHNSPSGHQVVANFIASDPSLSIYRRFGGLTSRKLATQQLQLSRLEKELKQLDEKVNRSEPKESTEDRRQLNDLLVEIDERLTTYHRGLLLQSKILSLQDASPGMVTSLRNWYEGENPVEEDEYEFLIHNDDLAALGPRGEAKSWIQSFIERRFSRWYPLRLRNEVLESDKIIRYSEGTAAKVSHIVLTASLLLLMVAALLSLGFMNTYHARLWFATGTLIIFSVALSLTSASAKEVIVATAGYASVMGAFLQKSS
ncbi:hypothetical protein FQN54_007591 [Arachnomyces sp. PD_36]|nr:hypothetical protein FQN54_007591 [Arachnomyces sp. PD_36]